jgi:hypothetical protein
MYAVYQSKASDAAIDHLNEVEWGGDFGEFETELRIMRDVKFHGSEKFTADMFEHYTLVARSDAANLDEVFHIGNVNKQAIALPSQRMHSISVGDIIVDKNTSTSYMVDMFGFTEIQL